MNEHYLYAGSLFAHAKPSLVSTVLGSCISVCLWDTRLKMGGINHYQLAWWNGEGLASPKYGNVAIEKLIEKMIHLGSQPSHLRAKLFGGANMLGVKESSFHVGKRNIELAYELLQQYDIPIIAADVGGDLGRKLKFQTDTGVVLLKKLHSRKCDTGVPGAAARRET